MRHLPLVPVNSYAAYPLHAPHIVSVHYLQPQFHQPALLRTFVQPLMLVPASPLALRFFALALPALAQLMVEPLARLVDLAYLGRLSATSMGAAGAGQVCPTLPTTLAYYAVSTRV
eukprot:6172982-Pleurochrysis_carterae.AAC.1